LKIYVDAINNELSNAKRDRAEKSTLNKFNQQLSKKKLKGFIEIKLGDISVKLEGKNGVTHDANSYQGVIHIDSKKKLSVGRLDGFWLLVTNHNEKLDKNFLMTSAETIQPYRDKVVIESAFRDIKSFVEVAPIYVWKDSHVKAHFTICVLAYLINRTITLKLHRNRGE